MEKHIQPLLHLMGGKVRGILFEINQFFASPFRIPANKTHHLEKKIKKLMQNAVIKTIERDIAGCDVWCSGVWCDGDCGGWEDE